MTKQELINTYDSMSMPEEHVEAIEARLKKLYDNPSPLPRPKSRRNPPGNTSLTERSRQL